MPWTVRSVRPAAAAMSRIRAVGLRAISTSTCPWPVSRVQLPPLSSWPVITAEYIFRSAFARENIHEISLVRGIMRNISHVSIDRSLLPGRSWTCLIGSRSMRRGFLMDQVRASERPVMGEVFETTDVELAEDLLLRHYGTSFRIRAHGQRGGMRLAQAVLTPAV